MAIRVTTITPKKEKAVYTQKMWIKTEARRPVKAEEVFYVFGIFFIGVMVMMIMYFSNEKAVENKRIDAVKKRVEEVKR